MSTPKLVLLTLLAAALFTVFDVTHTQFASEIADAPTYYRLLWVLYFVVAGGMFASFTIATLLRLFVMLWRHVVKQGSFLRE